MPCVLVGDVSLGGISHTMTAYDSLILRGFEISAIPMFLDDDLDNAEFVQQLTRRLVHWQGFQRGIVIPFPKLPKGQSLYSVCAHPIAVHMHDSSPSDFRNCFSMIKLR